MNGIIITATTTYAVRGSVCGYKRLHMPACPGSPSSHLPTVETTTTTTAGVRASAAAGVAGIATVLANLPTNNNNLTFLSRCCPCRGHSERSVTLYRFRKTISVLSLSLSLTPSSPAPLSLCSWEQYLGAGDGWPWGVAPRCVVSVPGVPSAARHPFLSSFPPLLSVLCVAFQLHLHNAAAGLYSYGQELCLLLLQKKRFLLNTPTADDLNAAVAAVAVLV
eukprot:scpid41619/ scgid8239/ 